MFENDFKLSEWVRVKRTGEVFQINTVIKDSNYSELRYKPKNYQYSAIEPLGYRAWELEHYDNIIKPKFNSDLIIEGLDRCQTIQTMINSLLKDHSAIVEAECVNILDSIEESLSEIYLKIGNLK